MRTNGRLPQAGEVVVRAREATVQPEEVILQAAESAAQPEEAAAQPEEVILQAAESAAQPEEAAAQAPGARVKAARGEWWLAYRADQSMARRLLAAQVAIDAVLSDQSLQSSLAARGYDAARMRQGQALVQQARASYQQQRDRLGDQVAATDARDAAQAQAHAVYMRHVGAARVALRATRAAAQRLGLAAARQRHLASWALQAQQFYANALGSADVLAALEAYGVTRPQLEEVQRMVEAVLASYSRQQRRKSAAQEEARARAAAFVALDEWMRDFKAIARLAGGLLG